MDSGSGNDEILRLLEQIRRGSGKDYEEACHRLYQGYHRRIRSFFRSLGFSEQETEDLTQIVFLRVFKGIDAFRGESRFGRWLYEIAGNVYRNELRRLKAEKRKVIEQSLEESIGEDSPGQRIEPVAPGESTEDALIRQERLTAFRGALGGLPPQMRRVCELRYVQQHKYQEIASLMKLSVETVKAHLFQARKRLAAELGEELGRGRTP